MFNKMLFAALAAVMLAGCAGIEIPPRANVVQPVSCFYVASARSGVLDRVSKTAFKAKLREELAAKVDAYEASFDETLRALSADGFEILPRLPKQPAEVCVLHDGPGLVVLTTRFDQPDPGWSSSPLEVNEGVKKEGLMRAAVVALHVDLASEDAREVGKKMASKVVEAIRAARRAQTAAR